MRAGDAAVIYRIALLQVLDDSMSEGRGGCGYGYGGFPFMHASASRDLRRARRTNEEGMIGIDTRIRTRRFSWRAVAT
jgi:hypothetical protein